MYSQAQPELGRVDGSQVPDFFISYTSSDGAWAEWIAWELERAGYSTVIQAWDFVPGSNFVLEMDRAARSADRTLLVLSKAFDESAFTAPEWAAAFATDPKGADKRLVPVRIEHCRVPGLLKALVYIDLVGKDEDGARDELLRGIARGRKKPPSPPAFPSSGRTQRAQFPPERNLTWDVPHPRNPHFTGRSPVFESIDDVIEERFPVALVGMPGVGKTQIATEFAFRNRRRYDHVWWAAASEAAGVVSYYHRMAEGLGVGSPGERFESSWPALKRWLQEHDRWLLVFDSAAPPDLLTQYLPPLDGGHLLVTSLYRTWDRAARVIDVETFSPDESFEFLTRRTTSEVANSEVASELGHLPLAMEQAAAYIQAVGLSPAAYLKRMKTDLVPLLDAEAPMTYPRPLASTIDLSLEEVSKSYPSARHLLDLLCMFGGEPVPREAVDVLGRGLDEKETSGTLAVDKALSVLAQMSLITATSDRLSLHGLTQRLVRARLDPGHESSLLIMAGTGLRSLLELDPYNPETWERCNELMPHCLVLGRALLKRESDEALTVSLGAQHLDFVSTYLHAIGDPGAAEQILHEALREAARHSGAGLTQVRLYARLGSLEVEIGKLREAERHLLEALEMGEFSPDDKSLERAVLLHRLGTVYSALERFSEAEQLLRAALEIFVHIGDETEAASVKHSLGIVMGQVGKLDEAQSQLEELLEFLREREPLDRERLATTLANLGNVLNLRGDHHGAEEVLTEAMRIDEEMYGPTHPRVVTHLVNLAVAQCSMKQFKTAQANLERALEINEATFGPDHPALVLALFNLASLHNENNRRSEARELLERALAIGVEHYGRTTQQVLEIKLSIAHLHMDDGEIERAAVLINGITDRDLEGLEGTEAVARALKKLGGATVRAGDLQMAAECYARALDIDAGRVRAPHIDIAADVQGLGVVWLLLGEREAGLDHLIAAVEMLEELFGPDDARVVKLRQGLTKLSREGEPE